MNVVNFMNFVIFCEFYEFCEAKDVKCSAGSPSNKRTKIHKKLKKKIVVNFMNVAIVDFAGEFAIL